MAEPHGLGAGRLSHSLIAGRRLRGAVAEPCLLRIKCTEQAGRDGGAVTLLLPRHAGTASHTDEGPRVTRGPGDRWGLWGPQACGDQGQQEVDGVCGDTHQQSQVSLSSIP